MIRFQSRSNRQLQCTLALVYKADKDGNGRKVLYRLSYLRPDGRWVGLEPTTTRLAGEVTVAYNAALYQVVQTDKIENRLYGRPACWATLPDWWKGMGSNHLFPACIAK